MSGIYIKGMEMPAEPGPHKIRFFVREDGTASCWGLEEYIPYEPLEVIPVPEHGRLIDADALLYTRLYKDNWIRGTGREAPAVWKEDVDSAPTIIPADEEGEG